MSDSYQRGRQNAQAFISQWKDFDKKSLKVVVEDLRKRRRGLRIFRATNASKVRFVVGIASILLKGSSIEITRADYAQLSGLSKGTLKQLLEKDMSIREVVQGDEEKVGLGPRKPGPQGKLVSYVLRDMEFRESMKHDPEFSRGFWDEFQECTTKGEIIISRNLQEFAEEYRRGFRSSELLRAFKEYRKLIEETESRIEAFCEQKTDLRQHPDLNPIVNPIYKITEPLLVQNGEKAIAFLTTLCDETKTAIQHARHGKFSSRFASSVIRVDISDFRSLWSDFLRIAVMLYFVSPWATDEFVKYTEFFKPPSG